MIFAVLGCDRGCDPKATPSDGPKEYVCEPLTDLRAELSCNCSVVGGEDKTFSVPVHDVTEAWPENPSFHEEQVTCLIATRADGQMYLFVNLFGSDSDVDRVIRSRRTCFDRSDSTGGPIPLDGTGKCVFMQPGLFVTCDDPVCGRPPRRTQ